MRFSLWFNLGEIYSLGNYVVVLFQVDLFISCCFTQVACAFGYT